MNDTEVKNHGLSENPEFQTFMQIQNDIEAAKLAVVNDMPRSRETSLTITKLDEAAMWLEAHYNRNS